MKAYNTANVLRRSFISPSPSSDPKARREAACRAGRQIPSQPILTAGGRVANQGHPGQAATADTTGKTGKGDCSCLVDSPSRPAAC